MFSKRLPFLLKCASVAVLGLAVITSSCKRNDDDDSGIIDVDATSYADDQLIFEQIYSNADRIVEKALSVVADPSKDLLRAVGPCATVKDDTTKDPGINILTIDFGQGTCVGADGRYRRGRLLVEYTKAFKVNEKGHYHKITFNQYMFEGYRVGGYKEVANKGKNDIFNYVFDVASVDTVYLPENTGRITGISERKREFYEGEATPETSDDKYRLTGFGRFVSLEKENYSVEIHKPLVDAYNCNWINEGVINIFPENSTQRILNFGRGECDNDATIDVNGVVRNVKIP